MNSHSLKTRITLLLLACSSLLIPALATAHMNASTQFSTSQGLQGQADLVVVVKSARKLYLYQDGMVMAEYPIALGLNPLGTKHMKGDNKTPVGAYTLDWRNPDSDFYRSIHISYPSTQDRAWAARMGVSPGGEIMIHGQPTYDDQPRFGDWTHGCIAVSDADIRAIWNHVPDGTPIHIYP